MIASGYYRWLCESLTDISGFSEHIVRRPLRGYQLRPAAAIMHSILHGRGLTFAVMMSRQAGKNELSAQLEAYLMNLHVRAGGGIVKASPTFKPQTLNSIMPADRPAGQRLERAQAQRVPLPAARRLHRRTRRRAGLLLLR